jgi:hypothetical protein
LEGGEHETLHSTCGEASPFHAELTRIVEKGFAALAFLHRHWLSWHPRGCRLAMLAVCAAVGGGRFDPRRHFGFEASPGTGISSTRSG